MSVFSREQSGHRLAMEPRKPAPASRSSLAAVIGWGLAALALFLVPPPQIPLLIGLLAVARLAVLVQALRALFSGLGLTSSGEDEVFR